jgi:endoglucanase
MRLLLLLMFLLLPGSASALEIAGAAFMDGGQPIRLKGIAMGDVCDLPAAENPYPEITGTWRANAVRLSIHPGFWRDNRALALEALARHVAWARGAGLYVIIDYHVIGWPDGYTQAFFVASDTETTDWYDARRSLAADFWHEIATRFRDDDILFELWNEPAQSAEEDLVEDGSRWRALRPHWQYLTDLIRATGSRNVILAAGSQWAYDLSGIAAGPLPDANTAYVWHVYPGTDYTERTKLVAAIAARHPLIVTEWGFEPGSPEHWAGGVADFGQPFTALLDRFQLSYIGWCWNPDYGPSLRRDEKGAPTVWGAFLKDYLSR